MLHLESGQPQPLSWLEASFQTHSCTQGVENKPFWNGTSLSFKPKLLVNCSWKRREQECERQKPLHVVTSSALAACSQKSYCPSFKRTPLSNFQARNEFTQLKVLHHFPLFVFSHGIGIYRASARAKIYPATSLLHYSLWWSNTNVNTSGGANKRWIAV